MESSTTRVTESVVAVSTDVELSRIGMVDVDRSTFRTRYDLTPTESVEDLLGVLSDVLTSRTSSLSGVLITLKIG